MLGKLMKYEWKAMWKILLLINAFTVFVTLLGVGAMQLIVSDSFHEADIMAIFVVLLFMLYYATIIGVSFAVTIYTGVRFYKNLYTDEGYLMHTLPVTKNQLIISKLTIHSLCVAITGFLVACSVVVLLLPLFAVMLEDPTISLSYIWSELCTMLFDELGVSLLAVIGTMLFYLVVLVISTISGVLSMYCAISIGQTFQKHKVMGSILCYVGIYSLLQALNTVLMMPIMILNQTGSNSDFDFLIYMNQILGLTLISSLVTGAVFYFITYHMMGKKLNLD